MYPIKHHYIRTMFFKLFKTKKLSKKFKKVIDNVKKVWYNYSINEKRTMEV